MDGGAGIDTVIDISTDWRKARLDPADHAMLEFAEKLTLLPSGIEQEDIASLRRHSFGDGEILSVVLAAAYRNFIIRVADSLGAELDPGHRFPNEILDAFGVTKDEAGTTLYQDRLKNTVDMYPSPPRLSTPAIVRSMSEAACWIDTASPDPDLTAMVAREVEAATMPHPLTNLASAFGLRPKSLQAISDFAKLVGWNGSGLGLQVEAIIGIVVAHNLGVPYMGIHHAQALLDAGGTEEQLAALVGDTSLAGLDPRWQQIALFSEKLTRQPNTMTLADVDDLRSYGFDDEGIITIAAGVSFENFLCCVASGLGVAFEDNTFAAAAIDAFEESQEK